MNCDLLIHTGNVLPPFSQRKGLRVISLPRTHPPSFFCSLSYPTTPPQRQTLCYQDVKHKLIKSTVMFHVICHSSVTIFWHAKRPFKMLVVEISFCISAALLCILSLWQSLQWPKVKRLIGFGSEWRSQFFKAAFYYYSMHHFAAIWKLMIYRLCQRMLLSEHFHELFCKGCVWECTEYRGPKFSRHFPEFISENRCAPFVLLSRGIRLSTHYVSDSSRWDFAAIPLFHINDNSIVWVLECWLSNKQASWTCHLGLWGFVPFAN